MAKGAVVLLMVFLAFVGVVYYENNYYAMLPSTNSTKPKPPPPFWGGPGTTTPILPPDQPPPQPDMNLDFGLYWNDTILTDDTRITAINWGVLSPGENKSVSFYIRNEGNTNFSIVNASASHWFFQNIQNQTLPNENSTLTMENYTGFFTLTLDYGNMTIVPNEVRTITLSLAVSDLIYLSVPDVSQRIATFAFDITINVYPPPG